MLNLSVDDIAFVGEDIQRGECVLATRSGDLFLPDKRGGVNIVRANGKSERIMAKNAPEGFMPNGIALLPDRTFLMADLGPGGGVWHMAQDGAMTPRLLEVHGKKLEPTNFVGIDSKGRTWVTVSTHLVPREQSMKKGHADGYIVVMDERGARVVAEGMGFTNEAIVDPSGEWLYVNETIARCTSRFPIRADGSLGRKEVFAQYGAGTFPDGFTFDAEGGVWIVSVVSNRVIRATPDGKQHTVIQDADPAWLEQVEQAFEDGSYSRTHLDSGGQRRLANLSGIAFGGADLKTVYLASLFGSQVGSFRSPVAGAKPVHWEF
ncbi:SMP-30/gluconolactonase/LRE family protein [Herbaspirillum chlorophenolicum]|uniref:SMP-30/gluconolactonase/LRE family protein n=1 Tax=Herbaspirillum chlorophenolicum TaxID=211589 RepID=UPI00067B2DFE|nr:SMP-30/gluconolactonase/LRE family protein [Herbaspirillum chlorophenolicum]